MIPKNPASARKKQPLWLTALLTLSCLFPTLLFAASPTENISSLYSVNHGKVIFKPGQLWVGGAVAVEKFSSFDFSKIHMTELGLAYTPDAYSRVSATGFFYNIQAGDPIANDYALGILWQLYADPAQQIWVKWDTRVHALSLNNGKNSQLVRANILASKSFGDLTFFGGTPVSVVLNKLEESEHANQLAQSALYGGTEYLLIKNNDFHLGVFVLLEKETSSLGLNAIFPKFRPLIFTLSRDKQGLYLNFNIHPFPAFQGTSDMRYF